MQFRKIRRSRSRFVESEDQFIFAERNLLLVEIIERLELKGSVIDNSHRQEKGGIIIDKLIVLFTGRTEADTGF